MPFIFENAKIMPCLFTAQVTYTFNEYFNEHLNDYDEDIATNEHNEHVNDPDDGTVRRGSDAMTITKQQCPLSLCPIQMCK